MLVIIEMERMNQKAATLRLCIEDLYSFSSFSMNPDRSCNKATSR